mmetsp:Transcript_12435/g.34202  ORF Transcript_12435/g.34202 Transcript_12435/m.34202 type:complete len:107 (+) Transcript_12435:1569-1889(+)
MAPFVVGYSAGLQIYGASWGRPGWSRRVTAGPRPQHVMGDLTHGEGKLDTGLDWVDHGEVAYHQLIILPESESLGSALPSQETYMRHRAGPHASLDRDPYQGAAHL